MKVILLKEKDLGLTRPRPAGSEVDVDPTTAAQWLEDGSARLSEKELLAQAVADKRNTFISKPAKEASGETAADSKAKS